MNNNITIERIANALFIAECAAINDNRNERLRKWYRNGRLFLAKKEIMEFLDAVPILTISSLQSRYSYFADLISEALDGLQYNGLIEIQFSKKENNMVNFFGIDEINNESLRDSKEKEFDDQYKIQLDTMDLEHSSFQKYLSDFNITYRIIEESGVTGNMFIEYFGSKTSLENLCKDIFEDPDLCTLITRE